MSRGRRNAEAAPTAGRLTSSGGECNSFCGRVGLCQRPSFRRLKPLHRGRLVKGGGEGSRHPPGEALPFMSKAGETFHPSGLEGRARVPALNTSRRIYRLRAARRAWGYRRRPEVAQTGTEYFLRPTAQRFPRPRTSPPRIPCCRPELEKTPMAYHLKRGATRNKHEDKTVVLKR